MPAGASLQSGLHLLIDIPDNQLRHKC
jgi:hypothetical protein